MTDTTKLKTRREAANALRVTTTTIDNWRRAGKLQTVTIGGRCYFDPAEIERQIVSAETKTLN